MEEYGKARLIEILQRVDEEAALELALRANVRPRVVVVGGSAFMLSDLTKRPATHDIDILEADASVRSILDRYRMINSAVAAHSDELPYNFEDRLVSLLEGCRCVNFCRPSLEDLAVMKLYAWRPNDIADLTSPAVLDSIDWDALRHLVYDEGEARAACLSDRRYEEMCLAFEQYERKYHHASDV